MGCCGGKSSNITPKQLLNSIQDRDERIIPIDQNTSKEILHQCFHTYAVSFCGDQHRQPEWTWHWVLGKYNADPNSKNRYDLLYYYGQWSIIWSIKYGYVFAALDPQTKKIMGVATMVPPDVVSNGEIDTFCSQMYVLSKIGQPIDDKYPDRFPGCTKRLKMLQTAMKDGHKSISKTKHWYLYTLSVDPNSQGKGYGKALINLFNSICDKEDIHGYLECTGQRNIDLYSYFGFEAQKENVTFQGQTSMQLLGVPSALMLRKPHTKIKKKEKVNTNVNLQEQNQALQVIQVQQQN